MTHNKIRQLIREQLEEISAQVNYKKFPLNTLVKMAKKFNSFEDFSRFYSIEIYHGYYWHLTTNPDFKISNEIAPRDMSSMSDGDVNEPGALMITSDLENWDTYYNTIPNSDDKREVKRNYVALIDASDLNPKDLTQVSRGFGNEVYVDAPNAKKLKLIGVYKLNYAKALDRKFHKMIPQSKEALKELFDYANSN
jgi:hypothetical protein